MWVFSQPSTFVSYDYGIPMIAIVFTVLAYCDIMWYDDDDDIQRLVTNQQLYLLGNVWSFQYNRIQIKCNNCGENILNFVYFRHPLDLLLCYDTGRPCAQP